MHTPDHQTELLHLLCGSLADGIGSTKHPGQNTNTVREYHDALGAHLPQGVGKFLLVQYMDVVHGQGVGGVAVHDYTVLRVNGQPGHVTHEMGWELGGEFAAVGVAPQQLSSLTVGSNANDAQIGFRVCVHILEILAGSGDDEDFADDSGGVKAQRDGTDDAPQVEVLGDFIGIQQVADIAAVALVPAQTVHIRGGFPHFLHKGSSHNVFHLHYPLLLKTSFSYCLTDANHSPSAGTPHSRQYCSQTSPKGMVFSSS